MKPQYLIPLLLLTKCLSGIDVYVSSGSFSGSFYSFYEDSNGTIPLTELDINETYTFYRLNDAPSHPFYISDTGVGQVSSSDITLTGDGNPTSGITGSQSFTLSFTGLSDTDTLEFYCSAHTFMKGSFNLVSSSFAKIGTSEHFDTGQNSSFPYVLTTTLKNIDLESSQSAQKVQINFVENGLPEGAEYRIYRTTANGGNYTSDPIALVNGTNTIQVGSVDFNRTVKIQFSASASTAEFDQLSVNGVSLYGEPFPSLDVPEGSELASAYFESGNNATHPLLYESANSSDGLSSQAQQTFSLNVTALPENGATYIVYKTYNNGQGDTTSPTPLVIGQNLVTVNSVSFDQATGRTVRLLLSEDVAIDEFSVNGTYVVGSNSNSFTAPEGSELASAYFESGNNATHPLLYESANSSDGLSSQAQQTFSLNVTALPENGATYIVYKTYNNGQGDTTSPTPLVIGQNLVTVNSVSFDQATGRTVRLLLSEDVAIDEFSVNGTYVVGSNSNSFTAPKALN